MTPEEIEALLRRHPVREEVVRDFVASYESECECGSSILPGEHAGYIGGDTQASCWDCCEKAILA